MVDNLKTKQIVNIFFIKYVDKLVFFNITFLKIKLTKLGLKVGFGLVLFFKTKNTSNILSELINNQC
jgi:hypothetical protein